MKYINSYKLFEESAIKTDKSFDSVVKDVLADLIDEYVFVETAPGPSHRPDVYYVLIRSSANKITIGPKGDLMDISSSLTQLVSFLDSDYLLTGLDVVWMDTSNSKHKFSEIISDVITYPSSTGQPKIKNGEKFFSNCIKLFYQNHYFENNKFKSVSDVRLEFRRSNESVLNYKLSKSEFHLLHSDSEKTVVLDKFLNDTSRFYYILFKNSKIGALKLVYDLNSRSKQNFRVYDNYNAEIDFNKLDIYLMQNDMRYGTFNDAWYYIEDDFNNQGYH